MEENGKIKLSDGKRELVSSETSKLWKTDQAPKPCSVLSRASTNNIDVGGSQFKVFGADCTEKRHYLCEYKGLYESHQTYCFTTIRYEKIISRTPSR